MRCCETLGLLTATPEGPTCQAPAFGSTKYEEKWFGTSVCLASSSLTGTPGSTALLLPEREAGRTSKGSSWSSLQRVSSSFRHSAMLFRRRSFRLSSSATIMSNRFCGTRWREAGWGRGEPGGGDERDNGWRSCAGAKRRGRRGKGQGCAASQGRTVGERRGSDSPGCPAPSGSSGPSRRPQPPSP